MTDDGRDKPSGRRPQRFGRYEIVAHIASGGMGAVYKARDPQDDRIVALKVMAPELAAKRNMLTRFRREAMSAARLRHENIVTLHEFGEANGTFYLALEFVAGQDLHDYIARAAGGRLAPEEARRLALQAAQALDHIHQAGVVHRDVKPSNFLVVERPEGPLLKLTDLGLARHEDDDEHRVTKIGTTLGTVDYMAPEQARDSTVADIRSDLYSLGCTLYHMLIGRPPFPKGTLAEKIVQHMEAEPPDVCKLNEQIPPGLGAIVKKLLAKKPADRYQTPAELIRDLANLDRVAAKAAAFEKKTVKATDRPADTLRRPGEATRSESKKLEADKADTAAAAPRRPSSSDTPPRKRRPRASSAPVVPWVISGGILVVAIVVLLAAIRGRRPAVQPTESEPVATVVPPKPTVVVPPAKVVVGPPLPTYRRLYEPVLPLDVVQLKKEFFGPWQVPAEAPTAAKPIIVSRLPLPGVAAVATLAEAVARASEHSASIIEIRDQGPHFLTKLPALADRSLWLRGAGEVRPLLAWDGGGGNELLVLRRGHLVLEGLDLAVFGPREAESLFVVESGDLTVRDCTFSITAGAKHGTVIAAVRGPRHSDGDARIQFRDCFARGSELTLVSTAATPADVLLDGVLAVGAGRPLVTHFDRDNQHVALRVVRSTLVSDGPIYQWHTATATAPRLKLLLWDALLARHEIGRHDAPMIQLPPTARLDLMSVKVVNSLYTGWRHLLAAGSLVHDSLDAWCRQWGHREGDGLLSDLWPPRPLGTLAEVSAASFRTEATPAAFAATGAAGTLGCDLGRLPPAPFAWKQRTIEPFLVDHARLPDGDAPELPSDIDGLYHGERIVLGKIDLGQHIQARLQTQRPAPRLVFHVVGKGTHATSPMRFRGIQEVEFYFEPPVAAGKEKAEPLTLELKPGYPAAALIEVEGGGLGIRNGRLRLENSRFANLPPHLVRVRGGNLWLDRCTLIGPLSKAPDSFQSLIAWEGAGVLAHAPAELALRDCLLQCGRTLLDVKGVGSRCHCRGSLLYSLADVVALELGELETTAPDVACLFENNTVAFLGAFLRVRCQSGPSDCRPVVVQAAGNYFLDPSG
ncbi:MAG: serine/threonine protein kinase, partial [Gemmataceae bacterium]|nr:serine/threonine protein kinase [Gemmataceae bacterium]